MRYLDSKQLQKSLDHVAITPQNLHTELSRLLLSSKKIVSKVESCNEKTGEYCIKLEGTLDTELEQTRR